jgi:hypothetical protein
MSPIHLEAQSESPLQNWEPQRRTRNVKAGNGTGLGVGVVAGDDEDKPKRPTLGEKSRERLHPRGRGASIARLGLGTR